MNTDKILHKVIQLYGYNTDAYVIYIIITIYHSIRVASYIIVFFFSLFKNENVHIEQTPFYLFFIYFF
jgi:hypothetical protein